MKRNNTPQPVLMLDKVARIDFSVRSRFDRRKIIDRYIASYYIPGSGDEYRKSFEVLRGKIPTIPNSGTHKELADLEKQW